MNKKYPKKQRDYVLQDPAAWIRIGRMPRKAVQRGAGDPPPADHRGFFVFTHTVRIPMQGTGSRPARGTMP